MNYKAMTKEKLIEVAKEGRHLKTAVEAKDKEINELKANITDLRKNLKDKYENEINELKANITDLRKNLKDKYENEINDLKKKLKESEKSIDILADKKLSDIRSSYEKNEKQLRLDNKNAVEIAIKKSKELEELFEILRSVQRAFQGSLDMSINLTNYFEDKVTKGD